MCQIQLCVLAVHHGDTWAEAGACELGLDVLGAGAGASAGGTGATGAYAGGTGAIGAYAGGTGATGWDGMDVTSGWSWVVEDGGVTGWAGWAGWANTDSDSWDVTVFVGNDTQTTIGMFIIVEVNGAHKLQVADVLYFDELTLTHHVII